MHDKTKRKIYYNTVKLINYDLVEYTEDHKSVYNCEFMEVDGSVWSACTRYIRKIEDNYLILLTSNQDRNRLNRGKAVHILNATISNLGRVRMKRDSETLRKETEAFEIAYRYNLKSKLLNVGQLHIVNGKIIYELPQGVVDAYIPSCVQSLARVDNTPTTSYSIFYGRHDLQSVRLDNKITNLPYRFLSETGCRRISLPETLTSIGGEAFLNSKIEELSLPAGVSSIGNRAFEWCRELRRISFHGPLKYLGARAFADCGRLESIRLPNGLDTIRKWTFTNCNSLRYAYIPRSVKSVDKEAFDFKGLNKLEIEAPKHLQSQLDELLPSKWMSMVKIKYY